MSDMNPQTYYDEFAEGEWERLDRDPVTRMEFENTTDYLEAHLPESGHVLDVGGAAGRYACWLAERGHDVTLVDLSAKQVELARENAKARGFEDRLSAEQGDVRDLRFEADRFDAVCCLGGPLSHVVDDDERATAMAELRRVARTDSSVFVSVISRFAAIQDILRFNLDSSHGLLAPIAEDGKYTQARVDEYSDGEGWAECHFFRADEFESELEKAGFEVEQLVGLEGIANRMKTELEEADEEAVESVREVVKLLREDRTVVDFSEHMLAVCRI
ncbi:Methyltransferase domain-containing protein [Haladaptatus litoreus]|uniref:Methyltransferase domain-containing protein n=1 Tax=Haladaptatus litoreus TaxID=553468 RepID=A0A1N6YL50_9EURY|nr:class I SAM-dependent methyltransferase [Haladaptatus litoreus]SIR15189.1 Methyltransferase domain-containing protein [Haladaptatus litoreus]